MPDKPLSGPPVQFGYFFGQRPAQELLTSGGQAGLAERLLGGLQTLWPVLVILSCRLSRSATQPPGRPGSQVSQVSPGRTADPAEGGRRYS
jgi:hypothetical protein